MNIKYWATGTARARKAYNNMHAGTTQGFFTTLWNEKKARSEIVEYNLSEISAVENWKTFSRNFPKERYGVISVKNVKVGN